MERMKKNLLVGAVIAGALTVAAGTVAAQDYFFPLFGAYVDHAVPGDSPCGYTPIKSITPSTYEDTLMVWYLCDDNRVIARRFFRSGGSSEVPRPVYLVNGPGGSQSAPAPAAAPAPPMCPPGFVTLSMGGCVPPDHPLAGR